jgi:hypothetical protein
MKSLFLILRIFAAFSTMSVLRAASSVIADADIQITFDGTNGFPSKYILLKTGDFYWGQDTNDAISVNIHNLANNSNANCPAMFDSVAIQPGDARFKYTVKYNNGEGAGSFEIHYVLKNATVFVTLENVKDNAGYHLIKIPANDLVTLRQEDGQSSFLYNNVAGKLVDLGSASIGGIGQDQDRWGNHPNISILPVVAFVKSNSVCTMEIGGFCNQTVLDVVAYGINKHARIGSSSLHYQQGGLSTPDLIINQNIICRIDFAGDYDGNGMVNWLDAAKMVRDYMPSIPSHFMDDKYLWAIQGQVGYHAVQATFVQMEALNKRISSLIDNNPQVCYPSGWTEGGQDTAYPNVTRMNTLLGGLAGYTQFQKDGKNLYNTTVSLDDNYDDQYSNRYTVGWFDPTNVARDVDGNLMTFNAWNGIDVSYITGMAKYMRPGGPGEARVDYTAQNYGLQGSILIDAATWWAMRPDYDPQNPASAPSNLTEGKFKLFDRFLKKHNIVVISELLRFPALGHVAMTMDGPNITGGNHYGNAGIDVPFLSIAYRSSIYYGQPGGRGGPNSIANMLYNNNTHHGWLTTSTTDTQITDIYYNNFVPWFKLHSLDVLSFNRNSNVVDMVLSSNSMVHLDFDSGAATASYQGSTIINGTDITCPLDAGRIAFYSQSSKSLSYPLSIGAIPVAAQALYSSHRTNVQFSFASGIVTVSVSRQVPVILYIKTSTPSLTWSAPVSITTADATLNQPGTVVGAEVFGATEQLVILTNSSTFDFKVDGSIASVVNNNGSTATATGAFNGDTGNVNFNATLNQFNWDGGPKTIILYNLVVGQQYSVQLFALDQRGGSSSAARGNYQDPNDNSDISATFAMGDTVYVTGTFTANNSTMNIMENLPGGNGGGNINAVVVRKLPQLILTDPSPLNWKAIGDQIQSNWPQETYRSEITSPDELALPRLRNKLEHLHNVLDE